MKRNATSVGFTVDTYEGIPPSIIIAGLKFIGMDFIELTKTVFSDVKAVSSKMNGMNASFHLPLIYDDGWDFSCLDYENKINETIANINQYKDKLHLRHVVSHPPEPELMDSSIATSIDFLFENLKKIQLPVYLENVPTTSPDEICALLQKAKNILGEQLGGMCFDAPHFYITGHDPIEQYNKFSSQVGCVHLSDCHKDDDKHIPFNTGGSFPVDRFLNTLKNNFSGYLTLEIKPESLMDLEAFIESYIKTLRILQRGKSIRSRLRWLFFKPIIRRLIN